MDASVVASGMSFDPHAADASFAVTHDAEPAGSLLAGFSQFGLAGLTAVDYLVDHLDLSETGHIRAEGLPSITPFEDGRPRHHMRLFSSDDLDMTLLVGDLFVPLPAAESFGDAVLDWAETNSTDEITILSGIPIPHGPDQHDVFYVATDDYREARLAGTDIKPMGNGFLDGVNAAVMERGIDSSLAAGVFVTPVHPQTPDVDAAIRLLDAVGRAYDLDVDTAPLEEFAAQVRQYYEELSNRLDAVSEEQLPEDRMYM